MAKCGRLRCAESVAKTQEIRNPSSILVGKPFECEPFVRSWSWKIILKSVIKESVLRMRGE
jgi:hypothetical protein